jgi:hypothetical protein
MSCLRKTNKIERVKAANQVEAEEANKTAFQNLTKILQLKFCDELYFFYYCLNFFTIA